MTDNEPKTTVDKLRDAREQQKLRKEKIIENMQDFKMALNGVASTQNGKLFLKTLIKACGVFTPKHTTEALALIEDNAKRNIYLEFIRPNLEPELKKELES